MSARVAARQEPAAPSRRASACRSSPSRPGSSPSSASSCRMRSCILVFYIALPCASAGWHRAAGRRHAGGAQAGDPDALYAQRDDLASARQAAGDLGRRGCRRTRRTSRRRGSWRARATGSADTRPRPSARRCSKRGIAAGRAGRDARAATARRTLLDGRQHGRARRIVRAAPGAEVSRRHQGRAADGAEARSGVPAGLRRPRARAAGTSRCRASSAAARRSPKSTCAARSPTTRTAPRRTSSSPRRCSSWAATPKRAPSCSG